MHVHPARRRTELNAALAHTRRDWLTSASPDCRLGYCARGGWPVFPGLRITADQHDARLSWALFLAAGRVLRAGLPTHGAETLLRGDVWEHMVRAVADRPRNVMWVAESLAGSRPRGGEPDGDWNRVAQDWVFARIECLAAAAVVRARVGDDVTFRMAAPDEPVSPARGAVERCLGAFAELDRFEQHAGVTDGLATPTRSVVVVQALMGARVDLVAGEGDYRPPEPILSGRLDGWPPDEVAAAHARAWARPRSDFPRGSAVPNGILADWWDDRSLDPAVSAGLRRHPAGTWLVDGRMAWE